MGKHKPSGLGKFAWDLRELRRRAGSPSFQELAAESGYPSAVLADAAAGEKLPPLTVTLAFVSACGGDAGAWADRWRALAERLGYKGSGDPGPPPMRKRTVPPRRRRARVALVIVALVAIGLGGAALLDRSPAPENVSVPVSTVASSTPPAAQPRSAATPPPEFQATAGPACPMDFTRQTHMSSAPGDDGWREAHGGSWTGDGCDNRYLYASRPENYFQWRFILSTAAAWRCVIEVYVPDSPHATARVWYDVADRFENVAVNIGQFAVEQASNRGAWLVAATVAVKTAEVMIQIGTNGDSLAAGPLRLSCSRS